MLANTERGIIRTLAEKYRVTRLILFGSSIRPDCEPHDIDLGVEGILPGLFFKFYSELAFALPLPVDLVDLSRDTPFNRIVRSEGLTLYGKPS